MNAITPEYADTPDPTYTIRPTRQYTDRQKRQALRRTATITDQRIDREDFLHDISYILRHHISDKDLLRRIAHDLAHFAPCSDDADATHDLPGTPETTMTPEPPAASPDLATSTISESPLSSASQNTAKQRQSNASDNPSLDQNPLPERGRVASISEPGGGHLRSNIASAARAVGPSSPDSPSPAASSMCNMDTRERGPGGEGQSTMSEMSERTPVAPTPPPPARRPIDRRDPESSPSRWAGCA